MADRDDERPRVLYEEGNPAHRVRRQLDAAEAAFTQLYDD